MNSDSGNGVDVVELDHFVRDQLKGPSVLPFGRGAACNECYLGLDIASNPRGAARTRFVFKTSLQTLLDETNACTLDVTIACTQRSNDSFVR